MEQARELCKHIFEPPSLVWYEDWKLWAGLVGYCSIWTKWLCRGLDWTFESKALQLGGFTFWGCQVALVVTAQNILKSFKNCLKQPCPDAI